MGYGLVNAYAALQPFSASDFSNKTVTDYTAFTDLYGIRSYNVTVRNGASLTLKAPSITIEEPFTVEAGASLVLTN
jgi:hypothetical protein